MLILSATTVHADPFGPTRDRNQVATFAFGLDGPAHITGAYGHTLRTDVLPGPITLGGQLRLPWSPDASDVELGLVSNLDAPIAGRWRIRPMLGLIYRRADGSLLDVDQITMDVGATAGFVAAGWHAGVTTRWDHALLTHATPDDNYRAMVPAARDVWTAAGGGTLRLGIEGGVTLGAIDLIGRVGAFRSERLAMIPGLPVYAELGAAFSF